MLEKFIVAPEDKITEPIHIQAAGITYCDSFYHYKREKSRFYIVESIVEGQGVLNVNGQWFYPKAGDSYILPQYSNHYYYCDPGHPWKKYWFNVDGDAFDALIRAYHLYDVVFFPESHLEKYFQIAFKHLANKTRKQISDLGCGYLVRIIRQFYKFQQQRQKNIQPISFEAQKIKDYLDRCICGPIPDTSELCKLCKRSEAQMRRIFIHDFGLPPLKFLLNAKINLACQMLESSDISIKELAAMLGFADPFYFSRLFKRKQGISPLKYHQQKYPKLKIE